MSAEIASVLQPVAEPVVFDGVYTADQHRRLQGVVRSHGPWPLILAQHFASAEEVVATMSGSLPPGVTPTMDMFLTPVFRGYFAQGGVCLYPEIEDTFYNSAFLERARNYWKAQYAQPTHMLFNIQGPAHSNDPAHLDAVSFRGLEHGGVPIWLRNIMGKSGLFRPWLKKMAQVIAWYYRSENGGGFTYWPEGPLRQPKRLATPMWNRGVVVQNEMMFHRGEANGPMDMRMPRGLAFDTMFGADPDSEDGWQLTTDGKVIQRVPSHEMRFLVHWNAEVYIDYADLKKSLDHSHDLSVERVVDIFFQDLRARGIKALTPTDPLHDREFIQLLTRTYDVGTPRIYPAEAPGPTALSA